MMVRRTAVCTRAPLVYIVPRFIPVVPLICWSVVKIAIIVLVISRSRWSKRYSFDLSLNSSGVGALVESGVCCVANLVANIILRLLPGSSFCLTHLVGYAFSASPNCLETFLSSHLLVASVSRSASLLGVPAPLS